MEILTVPASSRAGSLLQGFVVAGEYVNIAEPCGSEPAREGVRSDNIGVECNGLFASKLAPTFDLGSAEDRMINPIPRGSELAREGVSSDDIDVECNGLFASRLAPTFDLGSAEDRLINSIPGGSEPAREGVRSDTLMLTVKVSSRAGSLPQVLWCFCDWAYWAPNMAVQ